MALAVMPRGFSWSVGLAVVLEASRSLAQAPPATSEPTPPSMPTPPILAPTRAMSLEAAVAFAKEHQPAVLAERARFAASEEAAKVPRAQWLPSVGMTAQLLGGTANNTTASYVTTPVVDLPRIGATPSTRTGDGRPYASSMVAAGVGQEVFDFGRIAAQAAAADARTEVQRQTRADALLDVTYGVEEAYFAVSAAKGVLQASEDAYARSKAHRELARAGVGSGLRSPIELARAEADLARFDAGRIRAQGGLAEAQSTYAASIGLPDEAIDIEGTPREPPDLPALREVIEDAARRDPKILGALAQLHAQAEQTRAIGAEMRPDLAFSGAISGRAGGAEPTTGGVPDGGGWLPRVPNWDVGVLFTWPVFEPVVSARARASAASEETRKQELAETRLERLAEVRRAYVGHRVARAALPALQQAVDAAHQNYAQADARFRAGLGNAVELADAETLRAEAEIRLALGAFDVARTRAAFGRAIAERF